MAAKRKLIEEFDDVSAAALTETAIIHGVVASVSPMKPGKRSKFFEGKLTDGTKTMRMVGFRSHQQNQLATYHSKPVAIHDCEVKAARQSQELEILMKSNTRIESSPKKFDAVNIENITDNEMTEMTLDHLTTKNDFDRIFVVAKVTRISETATVSGGITKQDVKIADSTGTVKLTLWEADIGKVTEDTTYRFSSMMVRSYQGCKYLSMPKQGGSITQCDDDIGEVADDDHDQVDITIHAAEVAAVISLESYAACIACKSKVKELTDKLGSCTKCDTMQCLPKCTQQLSAKLVIAHSTVTEFLTLLAFGTNVSDIARNANVTAELLLEAPPFTLTYNNVITSVGRP